MLMTLYKGSVINFMGSGNVHAHTTSDVPANATDEDWVKGSIFLIIATLAWASFFILQVTKWQHQSVRNYFTVFNMLKGKPLQAVTLKRYSAQLSLTALVVFMGTLQSTAVTFVMEHKASVWSIGWDMNLFAAAYAVTCHDLLTF